MEYKLTFYRLEGHTPVQCDMMEWAEQFEIISSRRVAETRVCGVWVSTVFLGNNHQFGDGPPLIFETMIFGGPDDQDYQERYSTWDEALAGHERAVALSQPWRRPWRYAITLPSRLFWLRIAIQRAARERYCSSLRWLRGCLERLRR